MKYYVLGACLLVNVGPRLLPGKGAAWFSPSLGLLLTAGILGFGLAWARVHRAPGRDILDYLGVSVVLWCMLTFGAKGSSGIVTGQASSSATTIEMALASGLIYFGLLFGVSILCAAILRGNAAGNQEDRQSGDRDDD